ncbi:MAG: hypothetical protein IRZ07_14690 [Microbispora sp.]|nr:hypothetical protein [Microbispora sp.]
MNFFDELDDVVQREWDRVHAGDFWRHLREHGLDPSLYPEVMAELYRYTRRNETLAKTHPDETVPPHEHPEAGHDETPAHDVESGPPERPPLPPGP